MRFKKLNLNFLILWFPYLLFNHAYLGWVLHYYEEYGPLDPPRGFRVLVQIDRHGLPDIKEH